VRALDAPLELLHGTELNIAPDGSVDWDEDFLAGFDLCVASVHSSFDQPRAEMTRRFVTACETPWHLATPGGLLNPSYVTPAKGSG
jgi:DNA polymerase (family 10)